MDISSTIASLIRNPRRRWWVICASFCLFPFHALARQADGVDYVPAFHSPPWEIYENDVHSGIRIEFLRLVLSELGLTLEGKPCPWKRRLASLAESKIDIMAELSRTPEREAAMVFVEPPYQVERLFFYTLRSKKIVIETYNDLNGLKIGIQNGVKYFEPFDSDASLKSTLLLKVSKR